MSAPTFMLNDKNERIITLWRNGERVTHVFPDHWLELRELCENGRGPIYYIIAHDYGTGEETLVFLKDQQEYLAFERELNRPMDEAANFKKVVEAYNRLHASQNLKHSALVEALRCFKFCDEEERKAEIAYEARRAAQPVGPCFFGVEPRVSDEDLKELCCKPLEATTDPLRLKELESRFPGATMVLSLSSHQVVVKYVYEDMYVDSSINHKIACDVVSPFPLFDFAAIGLEKGRRPQLMAEWRGMYIDLSHLF